MELKSKKLLVWQDTIDYGYQVFETHPLARIDGETKELWIGSKKVRNYNHDEFKGNIPSQYQIRVFHKERNGGSWGFNGGLDLLPSGKIWTSHYRQEFDSTEDGFMFLEKEEPGFELFTEEWVTI